jgi:hypothetical protein
MTTGRGIGLVLLLTMLAACGGDKDPTDPGGNNPNGTITATVNGAAWNGSAAAIATRSTDFIAVGGTQGSHSNITFAFPGNSTGTFSIPDAVGMNLNYSEFGSTHVWQALAMGHLGGIGSGSVTVTTLNSERVAGTFSFVAPAAASSGATGSRTVTNGSFNVKF